MSDHPIVELFEGLAKLQAIPKVYSSYIAFQAREALREVDVLRPASDRIIETVSEVEGIGDCAYAFTVTAHNGTRHRITIEVEK